MPNFALNRKLKSQLRPIAVLAAAVMMAGFFTTPLSVKASGPQELIGDLSSVCASTGTNALFTAWPNNANDELGFIPVNAKWGTPSTYTTTVIGRSQSGSAATLTNVPNTKDLTRYVSYPFSTGVDTRIVLSQIGYGDSVNTAINLQAKLFAGSGPSATAVTVGGVSAETAELVTSTGGSPYLLQAFDFPDTLLANNQAYELRIYIWGSNATLAGYDDFLIDFAPCLPAPPTPGSADITATTLSVPFTAPSITGGSPILNYQYSLNNGTNWLPSSPPLTSSPLSLTELTNSQAYDIIFRTVTTAGVSTASSPVSATTSAPVAAPVSSVPGQVVRLFSPAANSPVPTSRVVSLLGTRFDTVNEVLVGGQKVEIRKKSEFRLQIVIPSSMSGSLDLELRSPLNNVFSPKHFNLGATGTGVVRGTELRVAGFDQNSRKLTPAMKRKIDRWLKQNPSMSTLTCTGFTSLPKRTTDAVLSSKRGSSVCNFAKRMKPDLVITVLPGIEDPRPGSKVRRALLVLTP